MRRSQRRESVAELIARYPRDGGPLRERGAGGIKGEDPCGGVLGGTRNTQIEGRGCIITFIQHDDVETGGRIVFDRRVGRTGDSVVCRSRDRGIAELPSGPIVVAIEFESSGGVSEVVVQRPERSQINSMLAEDAQNVGLGDTTGNMALAAKIIFSEAKFCPGIKRVDRLPDAGQKRQVAGEVLADPAALHISGVPESTGRLQTGFVAGDIGVVGAVGDPCAAALCFAVVMQIEHVQKAGAGGIRGQLHLVEIIIDKPAVVALLSFRRPIGCALEIVVAAKTVTHEAKRLRRRIDALDRLGQINAAIDQLKTKRFCRMEPGVGVGPKIRFVIQIITFDPGRRGRTAVARDQKVNQLVGIDIPVIQIGRGRQRRRLGIHHRRPTGGRSDLSRRDRTGFISGNIPGHRQGDDGIRSIRR